MSFAHCPQGFPDPLWAIRPMDAVFSIGNSRSQRRAAGGAGRLPPNNTEAIEETPAKQFSLMIARQGVLIFAVATGLLMATEASHALPAGPSAIANTGKIMSDIVKVASKRHHRSYAHCRPNPSPPGGWRRQRGGVSLPPPSLMASDSRLKEAVVPLRQLANGVELYRFRYKGDTEVYVGVIAQQVARLMPTAVVRGDDGFLRVDYDRLGLRMMTWTEWMLSHARSY